MSAVKDSPSAIVITDGIRSDPEAAAARARDERLALGDTFCTVSAALLSLSAPVFDTFTTSML